MKSELTPDGIENLIAEARDAFPSSEFVDSVEEWYEDKGFITEAQEAAPAKIRDRDFD